MRAALLSCVLFLAACGTGAPPTPPCDAPGAPPCAAADGGYDLNDVSFLYPLPPPARLDALLALDADGGRGALLPRALYDAMPELEQGTPRATTWAQLRVVAVRVDPCFPGSAPPAPASCVQQVRLVAQPVRNGLDAGVPTTTADATVHLFYTLADADFLEARRALRQLKELAGAATDSRPLDVHPVMLREGPDGAYAGALSEAVIRLCGEQNLSRVAFMAVATGGNTWTFGAFDVVGGGLVDATIPRLTDKTRQGVQELGSESFHNGVLLPGAPNDPMLALLAEREMRLLDARSLDRALTAALRVEHPDRSSPRTVDCASCHVASRARRHAEAFHQQDNSAHADAFQAPARFDLRRVDAAGDDPRALRAFGYFGAKSALSQRTINESAAVAQALSALER